MYFKIKITVFQRCREARRWSGRRVKRRECNTSKWKVRTMRPSQSERSSSDTSSCISSSWSIFASSVRSVLSVFVASASRMRRTRRSSRPRSAVRRRSATLLNATANRLRSSRVSSECGCASLGGSRGCCCSLLLLLARGVVGPDVEPDSVGLWFGLWFWMWVWFWWSWWCSLGCDVVTHCTSTTTALAMSSKRRAFSARRTCQRTCSRSLNSPSARCAVAANRSRAF